MRRRGRPKKDPEKKKSKDITIRVHPSQKKILVQEKERCNTALSEVVRQHAFEEIEPHGGSIVTPIIYRSIIWVSGDLYDKASEVEGRELKYELQELESEMNLKTAEVRESRERREELWEKAAQETESVFIRVRISPKRYRWLQSYTAARATSTLLREEALKSLQKRQIMDRMETLFMKWARKAQTLSGWDPSYREEEIQKEMQKLAKQMYGRVEEEVFQRAGK